MVTKFDELLFPSAFLLGLRKEYDTSLTGIIYLYGGIAPPMSEGACRIQELPIGLTGRVVVIRNFMRPSRGGASF